MGRFLLAFLIVLWVARPALAGAWLREQGQGFAAFSVTAHKTDEGGLEYKSSLYAEWGLLDWMTVGLDANENQALHGHALLFARVPLADLDRAGRVSAELGVGVHHRQIDWRMMYKSTLSYGNSFPVRWGHAWMAIDAALEFRTGQDRLQKLDLTAGLSSARRFDPLLQIETSRVPGQPIHWTVTPSLMIRSPGNRTTWLLGLHKRSRTRQLGLKLALWRDF